MAIDLENVSQSWVRRELEFHDQLARGKRGKATRRVQEWLALAGFHTAVDGDFGPATQSAIRQFQAKRKLAVTGMVDETTWETLVAPLLKALKPIGVGSKDLPAMVTGYAKQHLAQHPREIGGQNRGPWVRVYTGGNEGDNWPWCAGFVSFVIQQAAGTLGIKPPIKGSVSCDILAAQAKEAGLFVREQDRGDVVLPEGSVFLNRRTSTDWTHTGFVIRFGAESFDTIEGNTNDEGSREGYEVCARARGYGKRDFISLAGWRTTTKAGASGSGAEVIISVPTTPASVIVDVKLTRSDGGEAPIDVPLTNGTGTALIRPDLRYILSVRLTHGPAAGFKYTLDVSGDAQHEVVCEDGELPQQFESSDGSDLLTTGIEAVSK